MIRIGLVDEEFKHIQDPTCYCGFDAPKWFEWERENPDKCEVVCFTERCYHEASHALFRNCIR